MPVSPTRRPFVMSVEQADKRSTRASSASRIGNRIPKTEYGTQNTEHRILNKGVRIQETEFGGVGSEIVRRIHVVWDAALCSAVLGPTEFWILTPDSCILRL